MENLSIAAKIVSSTKIGVKSSVESAKNVNVKKTNSTSPKLFRLLSRIQSNIGNMGSYTVGFATTVRHPL